MRMRWTGLGAFFAIGIGWLAAACSDDGLNPSANGTSDADATAGTAADDGADGVDGADGDDDDGGLTSGGGTADGGGVDESAGDDGPADGTTGGPAGDGTGTDTTAGATDDGGTTDGGTTDGTTDGGTTDGGTTDGGTTDGGTGEPSPYAGTYDGTFAGDCSGQPVDGTMTVDVDDQGNVTITVMGFPAPPVTGQVDDDGNYSGTGSSMGITCTFEGTFDVAGDASGTWSCDIGCTGTWMATEV